MLINIHTRLYTHAQTHIHVHKPTRMHTHILSICGTCFYCLSHSLPGCLWMTVAGLPAMLGVISDPGL